MDNSTHLDAKDYDAKIGVTLPFYSEFYLQTIDLVKSFHLHEGKWLDSGCGTGAMIDEALKDLDGFQYVLSDPSEAMISVAKTRLSGKRQIIDYLICGSQHLQYTDEFDVITAIQSNHYMQYEDRCLAAKSIFSALKENGVFIFFENYAPSCIRSKAIAMDRWGRFQKERGKSDTEVSQQLQRYGVNYFPITLKEHFKLLLDTGYKVTEIFWLSYMQVGIYAIK